MDVLNRVPVREQEPAVRAKNFEEVCYGYNEEEAMAEAARCIGCKNAQCVKGCPVSIDIPGFIAHVKKGEFAEAFQVISKSSALPAVCGRVCPQETQCEGKCIRGIKATLFPSVNWSVSLLTGQESMALSRNRQQRRMARRLQLSVPVHPVLPVQEISQRWVTM